MSEAIDGEGADFLAQKTPIVMAYWGAANTETAYGNTDFEMRVIGFPSNRGQMPVIPMTGWAVCNRCLNAVFLEHTAALQKFLRRLGQVQAVLVK